MPFRHFFGGWLPISYHGHITDALSPTTIASMMLRLAMFSITGCRSGRSASAPHLRSEATKLLEWEDSHLSTPCFALVENAYAAAFGPLVGLHISPLLLSPGSLSCFYGRTLGQRQSQGRLARRCHRLAKCDNTLCRPGLPDRAT